MTTQRVEAKEDEMETEALEVIPSELRLQRDPDSEIDAATIAAKALKKVIDGREDKVVIRGKTFLRYEDWQTVGQFYGYSVQTDEAAPVEIEGIRGAKAKAILLDRNGNLAGGAEAYCMRDEEKWATSPWFQLASMAQTRAGAKALRNRLAWVAVLAGYSGTPAEEMDAQSDNGYSPPKNDVPPCPDCGGQMWDNRIGKRNPKAPDFKCKDKSCGKGLWLDSQAAKSERDILMQSAVDACKLLNEHKDDITWTAKTLDAYVVEQFEVNGTDNLTNAQITELLERLSNRLGDLRRAEFHQSSPNDAERQKIIQAINSNNKPAEIQKELSKRQWGDLDTLSLDQLIALSDDLVPF